MGMKIELPKPSIKRIIDKTAEYVAQNGIQFEDKIKKKYAKNSNFSFLNTKNQLNLYYLYKLKKTLKGLHNLHICDSNKQLQNNNNNIIFLNFKETKIKN